MSWTVRAWMSQRVVSVKPLDSAAKARSLMEERRINQVCVVARDQLQGIVTDRDLRDAFPSVVETFPSPRSRAEVGAVPERIPVRDLMTADVLTVGPDVAIAEAAELLRERRIGALPVVEGGKLVGILTRSDLLAALAALAPPPS
jgi:acetoin utilization protein AcuB